MAIPENQLDTWSHQGAITGSSTTYATIKKALEAADTKYAGKSYEVFLQGSYGNDTNIFAESDVDIVIRLDSTFYYDVSALTVAEQAMFEAANPGTAAYTYSTFKDEVLAALKKSFGSDVLPGGKKAIKVAANGSRRNADVVVAAQFRRYYSGAGILGSLAGPQYEQGICFFTPDGRIVNYPKQHSANVTAKHQATTGWYKPMVRIFKNMRGKLIEDRAIVPGSAPSYFLEGLLFNVPNDKFGKSYGDTFVAAMNWILQAQRNDLVCANREHYLVRDSIATCWPCGDCDAFINKAVKLWNNWP